jgi:hypothetical protein
MPSLHTAMPWLCAFVAFQYLGWRGLVVAVYAVAAGTAAIYLGEHYAVDVVAGVGLAAVVYAAAARWGARPTSFVGASAAASHDPLRARPIVGAVALVAVAFACAPLTTHWLGPLPITVAFVERELVGRSPAANYLLGRLALDRADYAGATARFRQALGDLQTPEEQRVIRSFIAQSEARAGGVRKTSTGGGALAVADSPAAVGGE